MINRNKVKELESPEDVDTKHLFTGCEIEQLMAIINSLEKKLGGINFPIEFIFPNIKFIDKLTYIFLECICYYLVDKKHKVTVNMSCVDSIEVSGIVSSPLVYLQKGAIRSVTSFMEKFRFDIFRNHYRKVICGKGKEDTNFLGRSAQEIDTFLKPFGIDENCRDIIATVYNELVGNAIEHADTDCLIDIDIAPDYKKVLADGSLDEK